MNKITRLEIIDHTKSFDECGGRAYVKKEEYEFEVELSYQDDGRTLKIFIE